MKSFSQLIVFILLYPRKWVIGILIVTLNLPFDKKKKEKEKQY